MGNVSLQACDPTGTICIGSDSLSISGPGLGITISAPSCIESVSVGSDATTFTTVCPGVTHTLTISGVSSGDGLNPNLSPSLNLNTGNNLLNNKQQIINQEKIFPNSITNEALKNRFITDQVVKINIVIQNKKTFQINIKKNDTISVLKDKIVSLEGIPKTKQILTWNGTELLNKYNIGWFVVNGQETNFILNY